MAEVIEDQVSETVKAVQKIGADLAVKYDKLEGLVKEGASAQAVKDLGVQIDNAEQKYDQLAESVKQYKEKFDELSTKLNRNAGLFGDTAEDVQKNFEKSLFTAFKQAEKEGKFSETANGTQTVAIKDGHFAMHRKVVGNITTGNLTDGQGGQAFSDREISQRVISEPDPKIRIRQLLAAATMNASLVEYPQFTGGEGEPNYQVNEGDTKSKVDYDWIMVPIRPHVIAATTTISRQSLADIGWLSGFVSSQMLKDLLKKEDKELLYGAGGASALHGLFPQSTAYVASGADVESIFDVLIDAEAQLEEADYDATGFLLHPRDVSKLLRYKSTTKEYNHPTLVYNGGLSLNGTPIHKASQVTKGTGMVAEWSNASLLVREGIRFDVSYENGENFEKNLATLRIEERIALAMYRPKGFVSFNFNSIPYAS